MKFNPNMPRDWKQAEEDWENLKIGISLAITVIIVASIVVFILF